MKHCPLFQGAAKSKAKLDKNVNPKKATNSFNPAGKLNGLQWVEADKDARVKFIYAIGGIKAVYDAADAKQQAKFKEWLWYQVSGRVGRANFFSPVPDDAKKRY